MLVKQPLSLPLNFSIFFFHQKGKFSIVSWKLTCSISIFFGLHRKGYSMYVCLISIPSIHPFLFFSIDLSKQTNYSPPPDLSKNSYVCMSLSVYIVLLNLWFRWYIVISYFLASERLTARLVLLLLFLILSCHWSREFHLFPSIHIYIFFFSFTHSLKLSFKIKQKYGNNWRAFGSRSIIFFVFLLFGFFGLFGSRSCFFFCRNWRGFGSRSCFFGRRSSYS